MRRAAADQLMLVGCLVLGVAAGVFAAEAEQTDAERYKGLFETLQKQATAGQYAEGEKTCVQMLALPASARDPIIHYNYACMLARQGKKDEALASLEKAVARGFRDAAQMKADEDLASLRGEKGFEELTKRAAANAPAIRLVSPRITPVVPGADTPATPWVKGAGDAPKQEGFVAVLKLPKAAAAATLNDVCFVDALNGWVVGDRGLCLATADGGLTWRDMPTSCHATLRGVSFGGDGVGWVCGDGDPDAKDVPQVVAHMVTGRSQVPATLFRSGNGGGDLRRYWLPTNFEAPCVAWNGRTAVIGTSGGGSHLDGDLLVFRPPDQTRMAKGYRAIFSVAPCGGDRWIAVGAPVSVGFAPAPTALLYTERRCRALFSKDDGATWTPARNSEGSSGCLRAVSVGANGDILAAGDKGALLKSTDAGETWTALSSGATADLSAVAWGQGSVAVAVGRKGVVLVTADGGATWARGEAGTVEDLRAVSSAGNRFVAVGAKGLALRLAPVRQ